MSEPGERRRRREMERAAAEGAAPTGDAGTSRAPQWPASSWPEPTHAEAPPASRPSSSDPRPPTASRRALRERSAGDQPTSGGTPMWAAPQPGNVPAPASRPASGASSAGATRSTLGPVPRTPAAAVRVPPPVPAQGSVAPTAGTQGGVRPPGSGISDAAYRSRRATRDTLDPTAGSRSSIAPPTSSTPAPETAPPSGRAAVAPGLGARPTTAASWGAAGAGTGAAQPWSAAQQPTRTPVPREATSRPQPPSRAAFAPAPTADPVAPGNAYGTSSASAARSGAPAWAPAESAPVRQAPERQASSWQQSTPAWAPAEQPAPPSRATGAAEQTTGWSAYGSAGAPTAGPATGVPPTGRPGAWTPAGAGAGVAPQAPAVAAAVPAPAEQARRGSWAVEPEPVQAEAARFGARVGGAPAAPGTRQDEQPAVAFPSPRTAPPSDPYDDEGDEPVVRRYPYTWLHLIVLAVVAFVLGFLVVALWNHGRPAGTPGAEAPVAPVVVAARATAVADPTIAL